MWHFFRDLTRFLQRIDPGEYLMLLVLGLVIGFFCLRGFGSRSKY